MSAKNAASTTKAWNKTNKPYPERFNSYEEFITNSALITFTPNLLMMITEAGRKLLIDEYKAGLPNSPKNYNNKDLICANASEICAYVEDAMKEKEETNFLREKEAPDFSDLVPGKDHTAYFDYCLKDVLCQFAHLDLFKKSNVPLHIAIYKKTIPERCNLDVELYGPDISHVDIIKNDYPELYPKHAKTLAPYVEKFVAIFEEEQEKLPKWMHQIIRDAKTFEATPPANDASVDPS